MRLTSLGKRARVRERALTETKESDWDPDPRHVLNKEYAREREREREIDREESKSERDRSERQHGGQRIRLGPRSSGEDGMVRNKEVSCLTEGGYSNVLLITEGLMHMCIESHFFR